MESLTKNFSSSAYAISMLKHRFITMRQSQPRKERIDKIFYDDVFIDWNNFSYRDMARIRVLLPFIGCKNLI